MGNAAYECQVIANQLHYWLTHSSEESDFASIPERIPKSTAKAWISTLQGAHAEIQSLYGRVGEVEKQLEQAKALLLQASSLPVLTAGVIAAKQGGDPKTSEVLNQRVKDITEEIGQFLKK